jgi:hypothetical protein
MATKKNNPPLFDLDLKGFEDIKLSEFEDLELSGFEDIKISFISREGQELLLEAYQLLVEVATKDHHYNGHVIKAVRKLEEFMELEAVEYNKKE